MYNFVRSRNIGINFFFYFYGFYDFILTLKLARLIIALLIIRIYRPYKICNILRKLYQEVYLLINDINNFTNLMKKFFIFMHWFSTNNYSHLLRLCMYVQVWKEDALHIYYLMFYYVTIVEELEEDITCFLPVLFIRSKSL